MRISVNTALKQQEIIELLNGKQMEGITYRYKEKKGMNLIFEVDSENGEQAIKLAKAKIKAAPFGNAILLTINKI